MSAPDEAGEGSFTKHRYEEAGVVPRDYWLYVPSTLAASPPLVVYLHGCNQTAEEAAAGVRWNEHAESLGFLVVYPEQGPFASTDEYALDGNDYYCWNWFLSQNQQRDGGEPATIAAITQRVAAEFGADPRRLYLMGVSAGGVMASVMGATYPDLYAAISVFAGCGYACSDDSGVRTVQAMGSHARVMPVIVFQGTGDPVVNPVLGSSAVTSWLNANDLVDDGAANHSVPRQPQATEHHGLDGELIDDLGSIGELCVGGALALPCPAGALGWESYPYTIEHYVDAAGAPLIDYWIIHGLGHNYVGGSRDGTFADPHGPFATGAAFEFFMNHPMPQ